ncbi:MULTISPECIES: hypothetical protein [Desulfococcus]|jgi:DNA-directed RNA polymerase subunit RPC12/RpoP|uniref:Uncharacterized protein n=2 Tax=Desulfococcus multivorans TaxID=897 RepID=S7V5U2_DESML|nr:hypothetical protein [Desulfococcus multivorans]AOY57406.1 conserved uncharacterized protein [Desulfococcus multivorans]AQU99846.1 hypothetical protein B2D07_03025 [Desulfococcus multivorans]EPR42034.1 hypothetical protein dsmv_1761 [Desulfococcus multivorans DSM 2059]CAJ13760.1 hyothetical protein [Desulfococcus multivorans]SKA09873.1 hypothetical protein SAMN02745446_02755 [Desulfococcus multivorans DSM 2059]
MKTYSTTYLNASETESMDRCPYCGGFVTLEPAVDYAPVYNRCDVCGKRFIVERVRNGITVMRIEGAPCMSDPECRITEMSQGDEE